MGVIDLIGVIICALLAPSSLFVVVIVVTNLK